MIDTAELTPEEAAQGIILHLEREGFIGVNGFGATSEPTLVGQMELPICTWR